MLYIKRLVQQTLTTISSFIGTIQGINQLHAVPEPGVSLVFFQNYTVILTQASNQPAKESKISCGDQLTSCFGHLTSCFGHLISYNGHLISCYGHLTSLSYENQLNNNGCSLSDHRRSYNSSLILSLHL